MTVLNHTLHGWTWLRSGEPGEAHLVGAHGRRPVVLGADRNGRLVQRAASGGLVPFDPATPDGQLLALATTAPHDCAHEGCPGRENKWKLETFAELYALLHAELAEVGLESPEDLVKRKLAAQLASIIDRQRLAQWLEGYRAFFPGCEEPVDPEPVDPAQALRDLAERLRVAEQRVLELEGE